MHVDRVGAPRGAVVAAAVLVLADQFLLLGVNRNDRLAGRLSPRVVEAPARVDPVRRELDEYFAGTRTKFEVPLDWSLTEGFTRRVLKATARIPYGGASTYREMAGRAGSERAARGPCYRCGKVARTDDETDCVVACNPDRGAG